MDQGDKFDTWGVLEVMGHLRLAGRLTEQVIAGAPFLRIDTPVGADGFATRFFGASSVYSITPTDEATARAVSAHHQAEPIQRWELMPPRAPVPQDDTYYAPEYIGDEDVDEDEDES